MKKKSLNQNGFSIVEALVGAGLLGVVIYLSMAATTHTAVVTADKVGSREQVLLSIRRQIQQMIDNDSLWSITTSNDPGLKCFNLQTMNPLVPCNNTPAGPLPNLILYDYNGIPSYYLTGFTYTGAKCPAPQVWTFPGGNDQCPYKYTLQYQLICPAPAVSCTFPMVQITGQLNYSPQTQLGLVTANYGIDNFIRGTSPNPTAHTYECFTAQFGKAGLVIEPGNTWPQVKSPDISQVITTVPPGPGIGGWSVGCAPGWTSRGCSISGPATVTIPDMDHWIDSTGCASDNHGWGGEWDNGAILSTACCRVR
jgi:type II secretory pathway pseudopilin PulG